MSELSIIAVGDISLSGIYRHKRFFTGIPWQSTGLCQHNHDLLVGNLESPITDAPRAASSKFTLRANGNAVRMLGESGFNILNVANNHAMDFGARGLEDTLKVLDKLQINHVGGGADLRSAASPGMIRVGDQMVAFLSFCDVSQISPLYAGPDQPGISPLDAQSIEFVSQARQNADWVIVQLHWGAEMSQLPSPEQRATARHLVAAGADLIIGHHPHVLQPMEIIDGVPVWYSLGNFAFSNELWRGQKACGESFVCEYRLHPLARKSGIAHTTLFRNREPDCDLSCLNILPDGNVVVDHQPQSKQNWLSLCGLLKNSSYESEWNREQELAAQRRHWQTHTTTLAHQLKLRAFQFGLIRPIQ